MTLRTSGYDLSYPSDRLQLITDLKTWVSSKQRESRELDGLLAGRPSGVTFPQLLLDPRDRLGRAVGLAALAHGAVAATERDRHVTTLLASVLWQALWDADPLAPLDSQPVLGGITTAAGRDWLKRGGVDPTGVSRHTLLLAARLASWAIPVSTTTNRGIAAAVAYAIGTPSAAWASTEPQEVGAAFPGASPANETIRSSHGGQWLIAARAKQGTASVVAVPDLVSMAFLQLDIEASFAVDGACTAVHEELRLGGTCFVWVLTPPDAELEHANNISPGAATAAACLRELGELKDNEHFTFEKTQFTGYVDPRSGRVPLAHQAGRHAMVTQPNAPPELAPAWLEESSGAAAPGNGTEKQTSAFLTVGPGLSRRIQHNYVPIRSVSDLRAVPKRISRKIALNRFAANWVSPLASTATAVAAVAWVLVGIPAFVVGTLVGTNLIQDRLVPADYITIDDCMTRNRAELDSINWRVRPNSTADRSMWNNVELEGWDNGAEIMPRFACVTASIGNGGWGFWIPVAIGLALFAWAFALLTWTASTLRRVAAGFSPD